MSPNAADTLLMGADPKRPPRKRVMKILAGFLLTAVPMLKRPKIKTGGSIDHLRPYTSLIGAQSNGPNAKPVQISRAVMPKDFSLTNLERKEPLTGPSPLS